MRSVASFCGLGNELSGRIKGREFHDGLNDRELLIKVTAPRCYSYLLYKRVLEVSANYV